MTLRELQKAINTMTRKNKNYLNRDLYLISSNHQGAIYIDSISFPPVYLENNAIDCQGQASIALKQKEDNE